ncbi:hypothetical protein GH865_07405 [Rhodocyclus tenuis]|nr:hypothetical protein [Rhodocyclus gracilis]
MHVQARAYHRWNKACLVGSNATSGPIMSITVLSAANLSTPVVAGATASDGAAVDLAANGDGGSFAALLTQLGSGAGLGASIAALTGNVSSGGDAKKTDKSDDPQDLSARDVTDNSQLLATLGLVTPDVVKTNANAPTLNAGTSNAKGGLTDSTTSALGAALKDDKTPTTGANGRDGSALAGIAASADNGKGSDGEAAKLAASVLDKPLSEPLASKTAGNETQGLTNVAANHGATHQNAVTNDTTTTVATPLRERAWGNDFAQKIVWLAGNDKQSAQLTLNPPQMGPIEVSLNLSKDGATAVFVSPHAEVRDAIENALPKLREMLAGAGIELGQANVSSESFQKQNPQEQAASTTTRWSDDKAILASDSLAPVRRTATTSGSGLVDTFA